MSMTLGIVFSAVLSLAAIVCVIGVVVKLLRYANTPQQWRIPLTPAPGTRFGVVCRLFGELTLFSSLFKSSRLTWLFGWSFHVALLLLILRHFFYFTDPVWSVVHWVQLLGSWPAYVGVVALGGLLMRRLFVDRIRYISAPSDYLMLLWLAAIMVSGMLMEHGGAVDVVAVRNFGQGLLCFDWQVLPTNPMLLTHLGLVAGVLFVFPFSKLLHAPGVFFSPTLNQTDRGVRSKWQ